MKRIIAFVLSVILIFSIFPINTFAVGGGEIVDIDFEDTYVYADKESGEILYFARPEFTVTYEDGSTKPGYGFEDSAYIDGEYIGYIDCPIFDQGTTSSWQVGNTYQVTGTLGEVTGIINIEVRENPVVSIEIDNMKMLESDRDYGPDGPDGSDSNSYFNVSALKGTVNLIDGTVGTINNSWCYYFEGDSFHIDNNAWSLQAEESWTVGNTYTVTATLLGVSTTFEVEIVSSPIESIKVKDISIFEYSNGYNIVEENAYYNITEYLLNKPVVEITLKDGTVINDYCIEFNGESIWIDSNAYDLQRDETWTAGNTYTVTATLLGVSDTFEVEILPSPIESIEVENTTVNEMDIHFHPGGDTYYDIGGLNITVTFKDGTVEKIYDAYSFEYEGESYIIYDNFYYLQWDTECTVGNKYTVTASFLGVSDTFEVEILPSPIESVEFEDISVIEHTDGYYNDERFFYNIIAVAKMTFKDGSVIKNSCIEWDGEYYYTNSNADLLQDEQPWTVGNTYTVNASFLGFRGTFEVEIVPSPIESIEIDDISIIEYTNGRYNDENYYYEIHNLNYKATFNDGTVKYGENGISIDDVWYSFDVDTSIQYEEPWTAGNKYTVTATLCGVSTTFEVEIIPSPIESIEIDDISIMEFTSGNYEGKSFYYYNIDNVNGTATLKDGTIKKITNGYLKINGENYWINSASDQNNEPWSVGNKYKVIATLFGVSDTFEVTITPAPVKDMILNDIVLIEGVDSWFDGEKERYNVNPQLLSVFLKDGTLAELTEVKDGIKYNDDYYYIYANTDNMQMEEPWNVGETYEITGYLFGVRDTFNVTIIPNPICDIEIIKLPDKKEYLIGESFNLKGMVMRIKYSDGSYEDITINGDFTSGYQRSLKSEKLNRFDYIYLYDQFDEVGNQTVEFELFGKTCEFQVNVSENLVESISIRENADKTITITVYNSDNTSYDMKLLDICYMWEAGVDVYYAAVLTDNGQFYARFFENDGKLAIGLEISEDLFVKSNSLTSSDWYKTMKYMCFHGIYSLAEQTKKYNGIITKENIDDIIAIAGGKGTLWYNEDNTLLSTDEYALFKGDAIRNAVKQNFAINNIDLSLSEFYDSQQDTYKFYFDNMLIEGEAPKWCPDEILYNDGVWTITTSICSYYLDQKNVIKVKLNNEQKILSYSINCDDKTLSGWVKECGEWYYYENGLTVKNRWMKDSNGWVYLGFNGTMIKNDWLKDGGKWYHFDADGYMETEKWIKDSVGWVYLGKSGAMLTNSWCTDSQGWCYVGADGYAATNCWKKDSIGWIWLNANGSMTKSAWVKDGSKWYYLDSNGYMVTNEWKKDSIGWVYLGKSGAMLTNSWCTDSQGWCYVGADGYAVTNCWKKDSIGWIWLNANGSMTKSQWVKDSGKWYYLNSSGYMVYNTTLTIGGKKYTFNSSGVWI